MRYKTISLPPTRTLSLPGRTMVHYEVHRPVTPDKIEKFGEHIDVRSELTIPGIKINIIGHNAANVIANTVNFTELESMEKGADFPKLKYIMMMSEQHQRLAGITTPYSLENFIEQFRDNAYLVSGQRSLITRFPIPQANTAAIKIKGLFFSPMVLPPSHGMPKISPVLMKPYNGFGAVGCGNHFTAEGWVDPYDCSDKQVVGGRTTSKAMQELQINSTLRMAGFPVPYDLGIGVFSSDYYQPTETIHERPAYIAYAIKDPWDFRLFDMLYLLKNEPDYKDRVIHMMKTWGELLRNLHDSHFYWSEPYMENVGFAGDDIQMYDLENTNHLPTLTPVQAAMYRFNDLCIALPMIVDLDKEIHELEAPELRSYANKGYVDHIGLRLFAMMGITAVLRKNNLNNLSKPFLKGYFRKPLKINHATLQNSFSNMSLFGPHNATQVKVNGIKSPQKTDLFKALIKLV